jgi:pre-mRNA-splicing factor ATP-dependent RNA helicase DHX16
MVISLRE